MTRSPSRLSARFSLLPTCALLRRTPVCCLGALGLSSCCLKSWKISANNNWKPAWNQHSPQKNAFFILLEELSYLQYGYMSHLSHRAIDQFKHFRSTTNVFEELLTRGFEELFSVVYCQSKHSHRNSKVYSITFSFEQELLFPEVSCCPDLLPHPSVLVSSPGWGL